MNVEVLSTDPQGVANRGFKWGKVYFPPDREGVDSVMVSLDGEVY
jgi:hypothetical protein